MATSTLPLEPGDLLEFTTVELEASYATESASILWDPGDLRDYFLTDKLHVLTRVGEASQTEISITANPNAPLKITVAGLRPDVDEALDMLQASLGFIVSPSSKFQDRCSIFFGP